MEIFWFKFVKLVKGKIDHQHDFTLLTSCNGPQVDTHQNLQVAPFGTMGIIDARLT